MGDQECSLSYVLNGGPIRPLSIGRDRRRLAGRGDFNIDLDIRDLKPGVNHVEIVAEDQGGRKVVEHVDIDFASKKCSFPLSINWSDISKIQDVAHVVDGHWSIVDGGISPVETGYDRLVAIGDMDWHDYEVTVPITLHGISSVCYEYPSVHAGVGIVLCWKGHSQWEPEEFASGQPVFGPGPYGAIGWYCVFHGEGGVLNFFDTDFDRAAEKSWTMPLHVPHMFKVRVETNSGRANSYSLKVWPQGQKEPGQWTLSTPIDSGGHRDGSILLGAHHSAATFGNVEINPL